MVTPQQHVSIEGMPGRPSVPVEGGVAVSVDINAAVAADVDAAVAAVAGLRLMGWSARESDGTPAVATLSIVNGATGSATGKLVTVELAANESAGEWYGPDGLASPLGISIDHITGTVDVFIYHKTRV